MKIISATLLLLLTACAPQTLKKPIKLQGTANYAPEKVSHYGTDPAASRNTKKNFVERNERTMHDGSEMEVLPSNVSSP